MSDDLTLKYIGVYIYIYIYIYINGLYPAILHIDASESILIHWKS